MQLFLAKHECENAAVVIAADWPSAVELFTAAVHAWTTDKWEREDWPKAFDRERGAGIEVPAMEPLVIGTYFQRKGWEMAFRSGEWVRTGHDYWGSGLRAMLDERDREREQLKAAAEAESTAVRRFGAAGLDYVECLMKRPYPDALVARDNMRGLPVCEHRSCPANFCDVEQKRDLDAICARGGQRNVG